MLLIPSMAIYNSSESISFDNSEYSVGVVEKNFDTNIVESKVYSRNIVGNKNVETIESWTDITTNVITEAESFGVETLASEVDTGGIIENDDRSIVNNTRKAPYSSIVYIEAKFKNSDKTYRFSGFLIADNIVVTAAHCLYDEGKGGWPTSITVKPGKDGELSMPYGLAKGRVAGVSTQWKETRDNNYDWGAIKTYHSFVGSPGKLSMATTPDNSEFSAEISGYPRQFPAGHNMYNQVHATGTAFTYNDYTIAYQIDATNGQSGAPILDSNNIVRAIHSRGGTICNYGARITPNVLYYLNEFVAEND